MSEKRKWFDKREQLLPQIKPITYVSPLRREELVTFLAGLNITKTHKRVFSGLSVRNATARLHLALSRTSDLMRCGDLVDRDPPGLTDREYNALVALEKSTATHKQRETAQLLLCVHERYNFIRLMSVVFRKNRGFDFATAITYGDYRELLLD